MSNKKENLIVSIAILILIAWLLVVIFSGCSPARKAQREEKKDAKAVQRLLSRDKMDDYCADLFPVKDSVRYDTTEQFFYDTLAGETLYDTIPGDTVKIVKRENWYIRERKTININTTIIRKETADINACNDDKRKLTNLLEGVTAERDKFKARAKNFLIWLLILAGASGMYIFLKFKKIIK